MLIVLLLMFVYILDIGSNLTDEMYSGMYNESKKHEPDLDKVLQRSWDVGVEKIFITAGNLEEARKALKLAQSDGTYIIYRQRLR